jgi:hypothetical protein
VALPESLHIAPEPALARVVGELPESDALPGGCLYSPKCDGLRFAIVLAGEQVGAADQDSADEPRTARNRSRPI